MEEKISDLETAVSEKWGPTQFDWVIGRTKHSGKDMWFFYCGSVVNTVTGVGGWKHRGYTNTIVEALEAMLKLE